MYLPCLGSHLTIWLFDSKHETVISETELDSWKAVSASVSITTLPLTFLRGDDRSIGSKREVNSWETTRISPGCSHMTHGTKLVWNSFKSTLREPSKRREAVIDETTCAINRFKLANEGEAMLRLRRQMS